MKTQRNISKKLLAGLLSSAMILGASGANGIPLGLNAVAETPDSGEPTDSGEPAVQAEEPQEPCGGKFCDWKPIDTKGNTHTFEDNTTSWHYEDGVLTISGMGKMPDLPWELVEKRPWHGFKTQIKKIVIEDGVTSIGGFAFIELWNNLSVEIGKDVEKIGYNAFQTTALTEVIIPENVKEIEAEAFKNCWQLESVIYIDNTQMETASNAFSQCNKLKYQTSPEIFSGNFRDWTVEGEKPFADNDLSWSYDVTTHTLTISGEGEMPDWERVDEFTINPERPWQSFRRHITNIVIDDGVTSIGKYAFCDVVCHDNFGYVMEVEIGKDVEEIREGAFYNTSLTEIVIPENVQEIGSKAFGHCWKLESVMLPSNTAIIEDSDESNSFSGNDCEDISSKITRVESFGGNIENTALSWSYDPKTHTLEITGSGEIPDYNHPDHFTNDRPWQSLRRHIANIVIGNDVTRIGEYAFCDIWGHELLEQPLNITFGSGVQTIGANAFANCYMTEVVIPANVQEIGIKAFGNCWALESVLLPINTAIIENADENNSFSGSEYRDIRSKITRVGTIGGKFSDWTVTLTQDKDKNPLDPPKIVKPFPENKLSWSYDSETHTLTISGDGPMPDWEHGNDTNDLKETNDKHWQNRPWHDFKNQIKHVVIEEGVTTIGNYAFCHFNNADGVTVDIPNSVTSVGNSVFYYSLGLKDIVIPDTVTTVKQSAFWHCENLETIKLSENLDTLSNSVLRNCYSLKSVDIPESVTRIENGAFRDSTALTDVVIPKDVTNLGENAFNGCTNLKKVTFEGTDTIPRIGDDNVFTGCPCVANGNTGLIIDSCAVLDKYRKQTGWNTLASYRDNIDKTHDVTYTAEGAVITENCHADGCAHTATATLETKQYHTYTGSEIKRVTNTYSDNWYGTGSTQRPEYTAIVYSNNILVGIAEATLTVTNDDGTEATSRINFEILPVLKLTIYPKDWEGEYDGEPHTIDVDTNMPTHVSPIKITYGTFEDGTYEEEKPSYTDVGDYTIWCRVETPDGQVVKDSATVKIKAKPITDDMVEVEPDPNGGDPTVTVKDGDTTLTSGTDYTVTITQTPGGEPDEYTIKVTGTGNYTDDVTKTIPEGISAEGWRGQYDGKEHSITLKNVPEGATVKYSKTKDGSYEDENPPYTDAGTYTVYYEVTKSDNTTEKGSATIQITPKPLTEDMVTVTPDPNGGEPTVTVNDGDTPLEEGKDYKVTITSTPNPNGGTPEYTVTVKNIINANYDGTVTKTIPEETGGISVDAEGWSGTYDGAPHSITVKLPDGVSPSDVTIKYGTDPDHVTSPTNPEYTNVGNRTVYYEVELPGGQTQTGSAVVNITPKSLTDAMVTVTPDPDGGEPTVTVNDGDKPLVKDTDYTVTITTIPDPDGGDPKYEITVTGKGNYTGDVTKTIPEGVTAEGWNGQYDGEEHSITLKNVPDGAEVKYGTKPGVYDLDENPAYTDAGNHTVYYEVTTTNGEKKTGSAVVEITRKPLTEDMVTVTPDPNGGEPTVTVKDGDKPLEKDDDYTVTITTIPDPDGGDPKYEITVTGKGNYTGDVTKTIPEGVTAEGWSGQYDGEEHSITLKNVPDGAEVKYGTKPGVYDLDENPAYTDVGNYTVYYEVELPGGQTQTGSAVVNITPKSLTDAMVTVTPDPDGGEPTVTVNDGDTPLVKDTDYTVDIKGPTKDPNTGETKYEVKVTGKGNYKDPVTKPWYVIESKGWNGMYDGKEHSITVSGYPTGSTITYSETEDGTYSTTNPTYTNEAEQTVYYKVEIPGGQVETGSDTVKITRKPITNNMVTVTPDPDGGEPTVTVKDGDKPLVKDTDYTVDITPTPGGEPGEYTITVTGIGNYTDDVEKTIPEETGGINAVSADGWSGTYDGKPYSITVKDVPDGADVTYLQADGTYGSTKPTHTDVGTYEDYYKIELDGKKVTGSAVVEIKQKPITDPTVTVNVVADPGNPDTPKVTVTDGGKTLTENKDYTVTVDPDNKNKVTITGIGNYKGTKDGTTPGGTTPGGTTPGGTTPGGIIPGGTTPGGTTPGGTTPGGDPDDNKPGDKPGSGDDINITINGWSGEYDGDDHSVTVNNVPEGATIAYGTKDGEYDSPTLPTYTDVGEYDVYYKVEVDGKVITGTATVNITPKPVTNPTVTVEVVTDPNNPDNPKVTVKDGDKILIPGVDYTVSIKKIEDEESGKPQYEVTVIGIGNYSDEIGKSTSDGTGGDNSTPNDTPNPGTGNPITGWTWILLSAAAAAGITVIKSKHKKA